MLRLPAVCYPLCMYAPLRSADGREYMGIFCGLCKTLQLSLNRLAQQLKLSHQTLHWHGWGVFACAIPPVISGREAITNPRMRGVVRRALPLTHLLNECMSKPSFTFVMDKCDMSLPTIGYTGEWDKQRRKGKKNEPVDHFPFVLGTGNEILNFAQKWASNM